MLRGSAHAGGSLRGGRSGGGGLLLAPGGGPQIAGLADLLDDDVDLSDMRAAAAAAGTKAGVRRVTNRLERPSYRRSPSRRNRYPQRRMGSSGVLSGGAVFTPGSVPYTPLGRAVSLVRGEARWVGIEWYPWSRARKEMSVCWGSY